MSCILKIRDLRFSYPDGREALCGICLDIEHGQKVALLGPNGAGKSTLLLHLNGLLQGQGQVEVCGHSVQKCNLPIIRQKVGLVFQNPDDQLFMPTVGEDVAFGPMNAGLVESEVMHRCTAALEKVGLNGFGGRAAQALSLGEKKRVSLATVLAMDCELLALDEPTSGLDPRGRGEIFRLLQALPVTQLIATHNLDLAKALCERCVVLDGGKVVADGATSDVLSDPQLLERHGLSITDF